MASGGALTPVAATWALTAVMSTSCGNVGGQAENVVAAWLRRQAWPGDCVPVAYKAPYATWRQGAKHAALARQD